MVAPRECTWIGCFGAGFFESYQGDRCVHASRDNETPICQYGGRHVSLAASLLIVTAWLGVIAAQMIAAGKILSVLWPESFDLLTVYTAGVVVPVIFGFYSRRSALHADGATAAIAGGGLVGGGKVSGRDDFLLASFFLSGSSFWCQLRRRYLSFRKEK